MEILPKKSCWLTGLLTGEIFAFFHGKSSANFGPKKVHGNGRCRPAFSGGDFSSFFEEKFREKPVKIRAEKAWSATGRMTGRLTTGFSGGIFSSLWSVSRAVNHLSPIWRHSVREGGSTAFPSLSGLNCPDGHHLAARMSLLFEALHKVYSELRYGEREKRTGRGDFVY